MPALGVVTMARWALAMFTGVCVSIAMRVLSGLFSGFVHDAVAPSVVAPFDSVAGPVECLGERVLARDRRDERERIEVMVDDPTLSIESTIDAFCLVEICAGRCAM